jgi:hypothetical protein
MVATSLWYTALRAEGGWAAQGRSGGAEKKIKGWRTKRNMVNEGKWNGNKRGRTIGSEGKTR